MTTAFLRPAAAQGRNQCHLHEADTFVPLHVCGLHLQKMLKLLRRVQRVLTSNHRDSFLAGLQQHKVSLSHAKLSDALSSAVVAHGMLQKAFSEDLGQDAWGVIQRGWNLVVELHHSKVRRDCTQDMPKHAYGKQLLLPH
jgi:hypothetical protein